MTGVASGDGGTAELAGTSGTISGLGVSATVSGGLAATLTGFGVYQFDAGGAGRSAGRTPSGPARP